MARASLSGVQGVAAVVLVVVAALVALVFVGRDGQEPPRRVGTDTPTSITWTQLPGINGLVNDVTTGAGISVAVGGAAQQGAVWTSTDGATWTQTYARAPATERACPAGCEQVVTSSLSRVAYAHGRFVAIGDRSGAEGNGAFIVASTDGQRWSEASPAPFRPAVKGDGGPRAMLRDVVWFRSSFVVVGDLYTANRGQQAGLSPALWRSRDGIQWTRRVLDLGDGFDPYMTGLAVKDGTLVTSGGYEHGYGAWITNDLRRWSFHLIEEHGGSSIVAVHEGFVASGATCVPTTICGQRKPTRTPHYQPTLWFGLGPV